MKVKGIHDVNYAINTTEALVANEQRRDEKKSRSQLRKAAHGSDREEDQHGRHRRKK